MERSLGHFDLDKKLSQKQRDIGREGLKAMINSIFSDPANQELHYIQGETFFQIVEYDMLRIS